MSDRIAGRVGLVGVSGAGKTSIFCALTGTDYARAVASTGKAISGAIRIQDPRLLRMHEGEGTDKKLVAPVVEIVDAPAVALEGPERDANPGHLATVRDCDGYLAILKAYDGGDPLKQLEGIRSELVVADIDVMQRRVDKLKKETKRALPNREELLRELEVLEALLEKVAAGDEKAYDGLTPEDEKRLHGFMFYSRKPLIPLINIAETDLGKKMDHPSISIRLEMELLGMEEEERVAFMKDYGMEKLSLEELPVDLYGKLNLQTFITTGDKDVTAWSLRRGASSVEAAGRIHTDLEKGFINCEVVSFQEWEKHGTYRLAQSRGPKRVEGKAYVIQDFDILHVKFNV